jgi:hypothetical protein
MNVVVTRIVHVPIEVPPETLVVLDAPRRLYVGLSRDGSYYHVLQPTQFDLVDHDTDEVLRPAGTLACTCRGFTSHGHCYQATAAIAHEDREAMPAALREANSAEVRHERLTYGLDNPAGAGEAVEAARG